jgi:predicted PhzF superfamily epimerase YddE/YHI9
LAADADDARFDFYSRFFAPWAGIPEDPVTGSAHAVLAPYWGKVLGKQQLVARQCSPRGGDVWLDLSCQEPPGRVMVSGEAAVVMEATLRLAA